MEGRRFVGDRDRRFFKERRVVEPDLTIIIFFPGEDRGVLDAPHITEVFGVVPVVIMNTEEPLLIILVKPPPVFLDAGRIELAIGLDLDHQRMS